MSYKIIVGLKPIRFDWDGANLGHTAKPGVAPDEIEHLFRNDPMVNPDPYPASIEVRWRSIGKNQQGRFVFVVFRIVSHGDVLVIRPISARYMHKKENEAYVRP
jgi:uncharacterized protein